MYDVKPADALPWAQEAARRREIDPPYDGWAVVCLPPGPMISVIGPMRIVQTPQLVAVLYELPNNFRQIYTDGRALPKDPSPTFQGYSVGRWDGPSTRTEALHTTERYRRRDFGHIELQVTIEDPKTFTRPWTITTELVFDADTDLLEYVCNENEKSRQHFVKPETISEMAVDPSLLAKYAGVYEITSPRGTVRVTVTLDGGQLTMDTQARGSAR